MKVDFIDNEHFTIYYLTNHKFQTEVEMKNFFKLVSLVLISLMVLEVSGCGKVSNPEPIEGSGYPHKYPRY